MPRLRLSNLSRLATLAPAMLVLASLGARPAQAAGCHVPERPILGAPTPWERDGRSRAWEMADIGQVAPPILTHLPCPGEVPHLPVVAEHSVAAACLAIPGVKPGIPSESMMMVDDSEAHLPRASRLDRPPR